MKRTVENFENLKNILILRSFIIIPIVPFRKLTQSFTQRGRWFEVEILHQGCCVRVSDRNITRLHGDEFLVCLKVVFSWKYTSANEFFLQDGDKIQQVLGLVIAYIIYGIGRNGQTVLTCSSFGSVSHHSDYSFYYVINVGEVTLAVAVVEYFNGLTFHEFVRETEVCHVWTTGRTIDSEKRRPVDGILYSLL